VRRFKLYIRIALPASLADIDPTPAGRQAAPVAATFLQAQFDGNVAEQVLSPLSGLLTS
jgi:hypothetical protein